MFRKEGRPTPLSFLLALSVALIVVPMIMACDPVNYTQDYYSDDVNVQVVGMARRTANAPFVVQVKNRTDTTFRYLTVRAVCYDAGRGTKPGLQTPAPKTHNTVGVVESAKKVSLRPYSTQMIALKGALAQVSDSSKVYCKVVSMEALKTTVSGF